jgi:3',5'-cyclic AMP phosphodiesterase CpdA
MKWIVLQIGLIVGILFSSVFLCCGIDTLMTVIGPYPQDAQTDSITVCWQTSIPTIHNEVHWGESPSLGNITVEKNLFSRTFHTVTLTRLTSATLYYYTVFSDGTETPLYTFRTASPPTDTIQFVAYGDTRGGWDNWSNTLIVAQAIEKTHPDFVISTGDLVDNGKNATDWVDFFNASPFLHNSTFYPVLGNHENYSTLYFTYFSLPDHERWYSFNNGPVHFIGLDSNPRNAYRIVQNLWLFHDLRTRSEPFTIVFFHHPLYSSGEEHGNTTLLQKLWAPIFERFHVDVVFNGHDHDYERSFVNGVTYIVTGGGGAPLTDVGHSSWTVYSEKTFHYCVLTVDSTTLAFQAIKPDGQVFDTFSIPK